MTNDGFLVVEVSVPSAFELLGGDRQIRIRLSRPLTEWEQAALAERYESIDGIFDDVLSYETAAVNPREESFEEVVQFLNDGLEAAATNLQARWEKEHDRALEQLRPVARRQGFALAE